MLRTMVSRIDDKRSAPFNAKGGGWQSGVGRMEKKGFWHMFALQCLYDPTKWIKTVVPRKQFRWLLFHHSGARIRRDWSGKKRVSNRSRGSNSVIALQLSTQRFFAVGFVFLSWFGAGERVDVIISIWWMQSACLFSISERRFHVKLWRGLCIISEVGEYLETASFC